MGWGIKIPGLGINTGEFLHGDVGRAFTDASREANTPIGRAGIGGLFGPLGAVAGALTTPGIFESGKAMEASENFGGVKSRWDQISNGYSTQAVPEAIGAQQSMGGLGQRNAQATMGQMGGAAVGSANRMARNSKWDMANNMGAINQDAELNKLKAKQQGILGIDLPIQQGQEMSAAEAARIRSQNSSSGWGMMGSLAGAGLGFAVGGPVGAGIGMGLGGGLGSNYGRTR